VSFSLLRKRVPSTPIVSAASGSLNKPLPPARVPSGRDSQTGALARIAGGLFGSANPAAYSSSAEVVTPGPKSLYHFHEGDVFTPGTENYVFEYPFEFPLQTIWGGAFLRRPNVFNPQQPSQVQSNPNVVTNGIGGLVAGQIATQPLESEE